MIMGMEEFGIMAEKLFTSALLKIVENPEIALNLLQALDVDKELDFINIPVPVLDLGIAWDNLAESNGWKIQQNKITKHARIIDNKRIRRAWGTVNGMYKVMKRMLEAEARYSHTAVAHDDGKTLIEKLKNYKELLDSETITKEEYNELKKRILEQLN